MMKIPVVMSWSGGKDSAMALYELARGKEYEVVELMTSVAEEFGRVSHHGVREALLEEQARAIGLPLQKIYLPSGRLGPCTNEVYEQIMGERMEAYKVRGIFTVGFGDLFLADLRAWREANLAKADMRGVFPLWQRDTAKLAREVIALGFRAYLPCGENGEFHSFVYDGPIFKKPVPVTVGEIVIRDGRFYADLLPEALPAGARAATAMP